MAAETEVRILSVGARGDGVAAGPVYVPFTLPGERVRARLGPGQRGIAAERLEESPERVAAPCPHFEVCGGCALQHWRLESLLGWKRDLVVEALAQHHVPAGAVAPTVATPAGTRRRATFVAFRSRSGVAAGFHGRASHQVIDIRSCPVADPRVAAQLFLLRAAAEILLNPKETATLAVNWTDSGADAVLETPRPLSLAHREALAELAEKGDLARLSWRRSGSAAIEPVAVRRKVRVTFSGTAVEIPPNAFLQASPAGEAALIGALRSAVAGRTRMADLFAGCGTFTFAMAAQGEVMAFESDADSVSALMRARAPRVRAERRDLFRHPLLAAELASYDAVIFDPPRAGARAQAAEIAASRVPVVVGISCNPATFARDAKILVEGGYRLDSVIPVDQFLWSPHVELAGVFLSADDADVRR